MYTLLIAAAFSGLALASPALPKRAVSAQPCMDDLDALRVADNFRDLIGKPFNTSLASSALAPSFTDYSDSVIELINSGCAGPFPLGAPTFTNRTSFISAQSHQAPIPFTILNLWNTCNTVILRWRSSPGPGFVKPEQAVTGIIVLETQASLNQSSSEPFLISTVYSEFNSGAWLVDIVSLFLTAGFVSLQRLLTLECRETSLALRRRILQRREAFTLLKADMRATLQWRMVASGLYRLEVGLWHRKYGLP